MCVMRIFEGRKSVLDVIMNLFFNFDIFLIEEF